MQQSPQRSRGNSGVRLEGVSETVNNLKLTGELITNKAVKMMGMIMADILTNTQPMVPLQSTAQGEPLPWGGKLRESGLANVFFGWAGKSGYAIVVGRGRRDGGVDVDLSKLRGRLNRAKRIRKVSGMVMYKRENELGEDIALWTHEELLPYGSSGSPHARFPGTGPKYLESAFQAKQRIYIAWLRKHISTGALGNIIANSMNITKRGKDRFSVNIAKLKPSVFRTKEEFEDDMLFNKRVNYLVSSAAHKAIRETSGDK